MTRVWFPSSTHVGWFTALEKAVPYSGLSFWATSAPMWQGSLSEPENTGKLSRSGQPAASFINGMHNGQSNLLSKSQAVKPPGKPAECVISHFFPQKRRGKWSLSQLSGHVGTESSLSAGMWKLTLSWPSEHKGQEPTCLERTQRQTGILKTELGTVAHIWNPNRLRQEDYPWVWGQTEYIVTSVGA